MLTPDSTSQYPTREVSEIRARSQPFCTFLWSHRLSARAGRLRGCHRARVLDSKQAVDGLRSCISKAAGASADILLDAEQTVSWAGGRRTLKVLATPGHTNGCISFYDAEAGLVFTGDAMLIGGCGRTDFQQGDARVLYESNHTQLFTLPPSTLVLPAHDYKGRSFSTIGAERATNPRLTKSKDEFVSIMASLGLPYPKKMDIAVPANMVCGV